MGALDFLSDEEDPNLGVPSEFGSTDVTDPTAGIDAASIPQIDTSSLGSNPTISNLYSLYQAQAQAEQEKAVQALAAAKASSGYTTNQDIGSAILGLSPILIGALFGKKGMEAGALAGATGSDQYTKKIDKENEQAKAVDKALANIYSTDSRSIMGKALGLQEQDALMRRKKELGLGGIKIQMPNGPIDSTDIQKRVTNATNLATEAQQVIDYIQKGFPKIATETYYNEDGSINYDKTAEVFSRKIKAGIFGSETDLGLVTQRLQNFVDKYNQIISGLNVPQDEFHRRYDILLGGGVTPQRIPIALDMIKYLRDAAERSAINEVQTFETFRAPGDKVAGIREQFRKIREGDLGQAPPSAPSSAPASSAEGTKFKIDSPITSESIPALRQAAQANGVPTIIRTLKSGKQIRVYDFGNGNYLPVE